ncbi:MAG: amidohydrolase family protein [Gemmatimonadales bacterium]
MRVPVLKHFVAPSIAAAFFCCTGLSLWAQDRAADRRRYLDPNTPVSDDPQRIPVRPGPTGPEGTIVLTGGRVFDGTGTAARPATIVIERNRIAAIQPPAAGARPAGARIIDVTGMTILPGLIDLHAHLTYGFGTAEEPSHLAADHVEATLRGVERLRYFIESGITSVRDVGSHGSVPFRLKHWVRQRRLPGPRVFPAGQLLTGTGGHGAEGLRPGSSLWTYVREVSGPIDWRDAVRENFKAGADVIKIASHFSREEVKAAVEEAHALGLRVTCDCETFYIDWAIDAGVDIIEHPLPRTDDAIRRMAERGMFAVPTVTAYDFVFDERGGYFGSTSRRFGFSPARNVEMIRRLKRAGVKTGVGVDVVGTNYRLQLPAYIRELKHFVEAGYTVAEALMAGTKTSAEILDMDDKLGTLEVGKLADVLVVRGQPDQNLDDLTQVNLVIRDGEVVVENGRVVIPRHPPLPIPPPVGMPR